jgi:hypothetical protein
MKIKIKLIKHRYFLIGILFLQKMVRYLTGLWEKSSPENLLLFFFVSGNTLYYRQKMAILYHKTACRGVISWMHSGCTLHTRTGRVPWHLCRIWQQYRRYPILSCLKTVCFLLQPQSLSEDLKRGGPSRSNGSRERVQCDEHPPIAHMLSQLQQLRF